LRRRQAVLSEEQVAEACTQLDLQQVVYKRAVASYQAKQIANHAGIMFVCVVGGRGLGGGDAVHIVHVLYAWQGWYATWLAAQLGAVSPCYSYSALYLQLGRIWSSILRNARLQNTVERAGPGELMRSDALRLGVHKAV
jgi:hypothetical protein